MSTVHDATVKIQSTFSLIHEARIQTSRDSYKMLQAQKFDPGNRTFVIKRAGHKYKENSRCSFSVASCPSNLNEPLVCTNLETSAKKFGNLFCSMLLPIHIISSTYTCICAYVALLTNLQTDCLKPDVFILRTDLGPFHNSVSCGLHATCHLF